MTAASMKAMPMEAASMEAAAEPHRFGMVALSGPPNVGKSTLLNRLVGEKISIISRRPQTTRHRILGIKTMANAQLVFVDTPGLHRHQTKGLNRAINRTALASLSAVDLIIFMIDYRGWTADLEKLIKPVADKNTPVILLINKIDRLRDPKRLLPLIEQSRHIHDFTEIIPISALKQTDLSAFLEVIIANLPAGAAGYPAEQRTDRSQRFFAAELVREQTLRLLGQELPYASAVQVTQFDRDSSLLSVAVTIWVEKASQKTIVIGQRGRQLKAIGQNARKQMEKSFGVRVHLQLWVKVRKGWADNATVLRSLGYIDDGGDDGADDHADD